MSGWDSAIEALWRRVRFNPVLVVLLLVAQAVAAGNRPLCAQSCAVPDAVESYAPGQGGGRGSEYLPESVLGFPDTVARRTVPSIDPEQVIALGLGGEIVLRFDKALIVDGPGPDFTVFENAFVYMLGGKERVYAEPAEVSVSRDGVEYIPFAFDSATLRGCAGVTPTDGDMDACDPGSSGGDAFDLADLGIDSIRFVRLRDVTGIVLADKNHRYYDATLNGFDLDAVVGLNSVPAAPSGIRDGAAVRFAAAEVSVADMRDVLSVVCRLPVSGTIRIRLFGISGDEIMSPIVFDGGSGANLRTIPLSALPSGIYVLRTTVDDVPISTNLVRHVR